MTDGFSNRVLVATMVICALIVVVATFWPQLQEWRHARKPQPYKRRAERIERSAR